MKEKPDDCTSKNTTLFLSFLKVLFELLFQLLYPNLVQLYLIPHFQRFRKSILYFVISVCVFFCLQTTEEVGLSLHDTAAHNAWTYYVSWYHNNENIQI